jgi:hypothetical protein
MKHLIVILALVLTGCGSDHSISGGAKIDIDEIRIVNPIIEFCERLHPAVLYPNDVQRETLITDCMRLCQDSGECAVDLDGLSF